MGRYLVKCVENVRFLLRVRLDELFARKFYVPIPKDVSLHLAVADPAMVQLLCQHLPLAHSRNLILVL